MDYKYIEQLLDKYWKGLTSVEEEKILQVFFKQDDVPDGMNIFKPLFHEMNQAKNIKTPKQAERKIREYINRRNTVKAIPNNWKARLIPAFKAVAVAILAILIGKYLQNGIIEENNIADSNNMTTEEIISTSRKNEIAETFINMKKSPKDKDDAVRTDSSDTKIDTAKTSNEIISRQL